MSLVKNFDRMVVLTADKNLGTTYVPPTIPEIVASVTDPNHMSRISSGLYTQPQVNALRSEAIAYFLANFGINFATGTVLPNGTLAIAGFVMIPYTSATATVIRVSFDSKHENHGSNGKWYGYQYGELIACTASGTFTSGSHAGDTYAAGDLLTFFDYNFMNTDGAQPNATYKREIIRARTPWLVKNLVNSQGFVESPSKLEAIDEDGKVGFYMENIMFTKDVDTGNMHSRTRAVFTWDLSSCN